MYNTYICYIDAPVPPPSEELTNVVANVLHANGEPTFTSLGLGGYGPTGLMQYWLEWLHISCDLPWWASITIVTVIVKVLSVPLAISTNKNSAKMQNVIPKLVELQEKMTVARNCGNEMDGMKYILQYINNEKLTLILLLVAVYSAQLQTILKKNDVTLLPVTNLGLRVCTLMY